MTGKRECSSCWRNGLLSTDLVKHGQETEAQRRELEELKAKTGDMARRLQVCMCVCCMCVCACICVRGPDRHNGEVTQTQHASRIPPIINHTSTQEEETTYMKHHAAASPAPLLPAAASSFSTPADTDGEDEAYGYGLSLACDA